MPNKKYITVSDFIKHMENVADPAFAMDWDNSGLLVGHLAKKVRKVLVALDATKDVINQAVEGKYDLLLTHHPLIFKGLKKVSESDFIGERILELAENGIALYSMHTNFDVTVMADEAADYMELSNRSVLMTSYEDSLSKEGIGKVGMLPKRMTLEKCADRVKNAFGIDYVRVYGDLSAPIDIVAISPGSGKDMSEYAIKAGADVLITGDIGHHDGIDAVSRGLCVIDASHYGLEKLFGRIN